MTQYPTETAHSQILSLNEISHTTLCNAHLTMPRSKNQRKRPPDDHAYYPSVAYLCNATLSRRKARGIHITVIGPFKSE